MCSVNTRVYSFIIISLKFGEPSVLKPFKKLLLLLAASILLVAPSFATTPEAVNMSGRQRMLTQKMTKEAFLVGLNYQTTQTTPQQNILSGRVNILYKDF